MRRLLRCFRGREGGGPDRLCCPGCGERGAILLGAFLGGGEPFFERIEAVQQRQHGCEIPAAVAAGQHASVERSFAIGTGELVLHGNLAGQAAVKAILEASNQGV